MLQIQVEEGFSRVDNGYSRVVKQDGNLVALEMMGKVFETSDSEWRGIGRIENSGLVLRKKFEEKDAAKKYIDIYASLVKDIRKKAEIKGKKCCICAAILPRESKTSPMS